MCNTFIDLMVKHHSFCQKKNASDLRKYHLSWLSANTMNNIRCKTYLNVFLKVGMRSLLSLYAKRGAFLLK